MHYCTWAHTPLHRPFSSGQYTLSYTLQFVLGGSESTVPVNLKSKLSRTKEDEEWMMKVIDMCSCYRLCQECYFVSSEKTTKPITVPHHQSSFTRDGETFFSKIVLGTNFLSLSGGKFPPPSSTISFSNLSLRWSSMDGRLGGGLWKCFSILNLQDSKHS